MKKTTEKENWEEDFLEKFQIKLDWADFNIINNKSVLRNDIINFIKQLLTSERQRLLKEIDKLKYTGRDLQRDIPKGYNLCIEDIKHLINND